MGTHDNDFVIREHTLVAYRGSEAHVTVPEGVTAIGNNAFKGCGSLEGVSLPRGLRRIGAMAFKDCTNLSHIELPEGLQTIEYGAFERTGLRSLHIPATVNSIGRWKGVDSHADPTQAFRCPDLERITVDERNDRFDSREGCNAIIWTRHNVLALGCSTTVIPDSVTAIGSGAFSHLRGLRHIAIPDSVTRIDHGAFARCAHLEQVTLGRRLKEIGDGAFGHCTHLRGIELPEGLERLGKSCFCHCDSLKSVRIPDSVWRIGNFAFSDCTSLERVWIGKGLLELYPGVFADCPNLREIAVDPENRWLGSRTFRCRGDALSNRDTDTCPLEQAGIPPCT